MSPEDLAELKLYMEETVARICAEVDAILSRNGLLDVIRARMAQKAQGLQPQNASSSSGNDRQPTTGDRQ
jgi:hypothetical protein